MYLKGRIYPEIGELFGCTEHTICHYVRDYRNNGLEGLTPGQSPGRPRNLTEEQELYQVIVESRPSDVGFPAEMNWNSFLIRDWIERNLG
ncbi:helix-turn-helix domain-containing protein [Virgibacillus dakarensis]|nr:helix-turn-helix domain-containing protein [Virgibacillus dakarensis]